MSDRTTHLVLAGYENSGSEHWQTRWEEAERARQSAGARGARYVEVGAHGHLNSSAGLGDWPEGRKLLAEL
ncbi:alpha/beta hydrolase [Kitasatospora sp. NPDC001660]